MKTNSWLVKLYGAVLVVLVLVQTTLAVFKMYAGMVDNPNAFAVTLLTILTVSLPMTLVTAAVVAIQERKVRHG